MEIAGGALALILLFWLASIGTGSCFWIPARGVCWIAAAMVMAGSIGLAGVFKIYPELAWSLAAYGVAGCILVGGDFVNLPRQKRILRAAVAAGLCVTIILIWALFPPVPGLSRPATFDIRALLCGVSSVAWAVVLSCWNHREHPENLVRITAVSWRFFRIDILAYGLKRVAAIGIGRGLGEMPAYAPSSE